MTKILITGGSGFLGRHLVDPLRNLGYEVWLSGRNNKQNQFAYQLTKANTVPLDITSENSLDDILSYIRPEIIIHAAATKFVDLSEKYPMECIDVNVYGSQNVARAAIRHNVKQVIGISTDKAAPPVRNIYGMSKALMEKMFCLLNGKTDTQFACVRYGNVAWSTGSVLPIWEKSIREKNLIQTTGPEMYRFFFSINEAVDLVVNCLNNMDKVQGKTLSLNMKAAQMKRIIEVWSNMTGCSWEQIEGRPGERDVEWLVSDAERKFTEEFYINNKLHYLLHQNHTPENHLTEDIHSGKVSQLTNEEIEVILNSKPIDA